MAQCLIGLVCWKWLPVPLFILPEHSSRTISLHGTFTLVGILLSCRIYLVSVLVLLIKDCNLPHIFTIWCTFLIGKFIFSPVVFLQFHSNSHIRLKHIFPFQGSHVKSGCGWFRTWEIKLGESSFSLHVMTAMHFFFLMNQVLVVTYIYVFLNQEMFTLILNTYVHAICLDDRQLKSKVYIWRS